MRRVAWRCRRGMRELDQMLSRYRETKLEASGAEMQSAFIELLDQEDDLLWDWLSGRVQPDSQRMVKIVSAIRNSC